MVGMKTLLILSLLTALSACAQVQNFTVADAKSAAAVAEAIGDAQAIGCYTAVSTLAGSPTNGGPLTKYELARGGVLLAQSQCAPVFAGLALHLLNKLPGTP